MSLSPTILGQMIRLLMHTELVSMWKETVMKLHTNPALAWTDRGKKQEASISTAGILQSFEQGTFQYASHTLPFKPTRLVTPCSFGDR
jgi:hypothetical protein